MNIPTIDRLLVGLHESVDYLFENAPKFLEVTPSQYPRCIARIPTLKYYNITLKHYPFLEQIVYRRDNVYTLHTLHLIIYRHRGRCVAQIPQISANRRRTSGAAQHSYNIIIICASRWILIDTFMYGQYSPVLRENIFTLLCDDVRYTIVQYTTVFETSWHARQRLQRSCPHGHIIT